MNKKVHLIISGRVQGVFFRASASRVARGLKINGFVRNLAGGNVELVGEGEEEALKRLADWCRKGPPGAQVTGVELDWQEPTGEVSGFNVRYLLKLIPSRCDCPGFSKKSGATVYSTHDAQFLGICKQERSQSDAAGLKPSIQSITVEQELEAFVRQWDKQHPSIDIGLT